MHVRLRATGRVALFATASVIAAMLGVETASASSSARSPDGGGAGSFNSTYETFTLDDIKCDSHAVYIDYSIGTSSVQRFNNTQGCNTDALVLDLSIAEGVKVRWKVCTNIPLQSDPCSPWIDDQA